MTNIEIVLAVFIITVTYLVVQYIRDVLKRKDIVLLKKTRKSTTAKKE